VTDYAPNFAYATSVLGQLNYSGYFPNQSGGAGPATLASPSGSVATDGTHFYVVDTANNRILGYNSIPTTIDAPANFVLGQSNFTTTSPGSSATSLSGPSKVAISPDGKLVVADANNNRVLIWDTLPTATGVAPDVVVGQTDFNSSSSGTTASTLSLPTGAMIGNNELVVVDQNNNRVLIWNPVPTAGNNGAAATVVLGQPDFTSNTAGYYNNANVTSGNTTQFTGPVDLWTDGYRLLVTDAGNNRVAYWKQLPSTINAPANIFIGQTSSTRTTAGTSSTICNAPQGVGSDGTQVYIADSGNNRVLVFPSFPVTTGTAAYRVIGQGDFTHSAYNDDHNNSTGDDNQDGLTDNPPNPTGRTLHTPTGVTALNGTIYVSDRDNNRVLYFAQ
jgi:hypothetical protein